eukprot:5898589-Pleurochrysis_carterae.AAC.1
MCPGRLVRNHRSTHSQAGHERRRRRLDHRGTGRGRNSPEESELDNDRPFRTARGPISRPPYLGL